MVSFSIIELDDILKMYIHLVHIDLYVEIS